MQATMKHALKRGLSIVVNDLRSFFGDVIEYDDAGVDRQEFERLAERYHDETSLDVAESLVLAGDELGAKDKWLATQVVFNARSLADIRRDIRKKRRDLKHEQERIEATEDALSDVEV